MHVWPVEMSSLLQGQSLMPIVGGQALIELWERTLSGLKMIHEWA